MSKVFEKSPEELCVENYITSFDWVNAYCLTLTLKKAANFFYEKTFIPHYVKGDEISYSRNLQHFLNRLNKKVFGNAVRRFDKKLNCYAAFEGGVGFTRPHFHLLIQGSPYHTKNEFERLVEKEWTKTNYGYREVYVLKHNQNSGWEGYISKEYSKTNLFDCIDWGNVNIMDKG